MNLKRWTDQYLAVVQATFGARIICVGLQGSYGRGEATPQSDLDMVLVLDTLDITDLKRYREAMADLPQRDKLCGFICGKEELLNWEKADALSLYRDTTPLMGDLDFLGALFTAADLRRNVLTAACGLYHACCHNYLFEQNAAFLDAMHKPVFFLLRAEYEYRTGHWVSKRAELEEKLDAEHRALLHPTGEIECDSEKLLRWSGALIRELGDTLE